MAITRSQVYYAVNKIKGDASDSTSTVSHVDHVLTKQLVVANNSSIASCSNPSTIELNSTDIVASISESGRPKVLQRMKQSTPQDVRKRQQISYPFVMQK